jgi:hypothetical protein
MRFPVKAQDPNVRFALIALECHARIGTTMQLSYAQIPRRQVNLMDIRETFRFVAPKVRDAAVDTAAQLKHLKIRYALAGGLAVGAHGYIRATTDVDFLVGDEAFVHHGLLIAFKAGVPIEVNGIRIDYLSPTALGPQLEEVLDHPPTSEGLAVVPVEVLIYMKLVAKRRKDMVDVIELVKAGADLPRVRAYVRKYAGDLVPLLEELVNEALAE